MTYRTIVHHHRRKGRPVRTHPRRMKGGKAELTFYDLKAKKSFNTNKYQIVMKKGRRFAVATSPSGIHSYRIIGKK